MAMNTDTHYVVGIDLGTTNCALSFVDMTADVSEREVQVFAIPQLVAPGEVAELTALPSFLYLPEPHEYTPETLQLPWHETSPDYAVGAFARDLAAKTPGKVVGSAKSWLCVDGLDRRADVLPYDRKPVPRQVSPVRALQFYLEHLRDAWNHAVRDEDTDHRLENQEILLTVPASFDAVARELTVEAAANAGLYARLIEEPQAAFYAWLHDRGDAWREHVSAGDIMLVCDIGGGTTDFTLIVATEEEGGHLGLERVAVGEHILLGGDNMDLTLAYGMAAKIQRDQGVKLDAYQLSGLTHACRAAKEKLESTGSDEAQQLTVLGRGTGVVGAAVTTEITQDEMRDMLIDGFFPVCELSDTAAERRRVGLRAFGLEYASDPAVTRHLAAFLNKHSFRDADGNVMLPATVLFNGGVTKSRVFQERIVEVLKAWDAARGQDTAILTGQDPDLAVANGAAWYGCVQRDGGVRIKSGSPRSYYLGIESSVPAVPGFEPPLDALCVIPFGFEEGSSVDVPVTGLGLVVGEQTEFRFFSSTVRQEDSVGDLIEVTGEAELEELPPLVAELPAEGGGSGPIGSLVPVRLEAALTEVGTLQLSCNDERGTGQWQLEFELRNE